MSTVPEIRRATAELVALAVAMRADWDVSAVEQALAQAAAEGMAWPLMVSGMARLMIDPSASPGDLVPARWSAGTRVVPPPGTAERGAAAVRAALADAVRRGAE